MIPRPAHRKNMLGLNWVEGRTPIIPAFSRLTGRSGLFKASLGYTVRSYLRKKEVRKKGRKEGKKGGSDGGTEGGTEGRKEGGNI